MWVFIALSCGGSGETGDQLGIFEADDTEKAIELIGEANQNLRSIRVLYNNNDSKVDELKEALDSQDIEKVKTLTEDLSRIITDGYVLAESALEKIEKTQELDIHTDWKDYLRLKQESIEMQIKAFNYRRDSARLFKEKFGGKDKLQMVQAKQTFLKNEENYAKNMAEAKKKNVEADELAKESRQKEK